MPPETAADYVRLTRVHRTLYFRCQVCDKDYLDKNNLQKHVKKHEGLYCVHCLAVFSTIGALVEHEKEYQSNLGLQGLDKYTCGDCSKKFSSNCEERNHLFKHAGVSCPICNNGFTKKYSLIRHIHTVHSGFSGPKKITEYVLLEKRSSTG